MKKTKLSNDVTIRLGEDLSEPKWLESFEEAREIARLKYSTPEVSGMLSLINTLLHNAEVYLRDVVGSPEHNSPDHVWRLDNITYRVIPHAIVQFCAEFGARHIVGFQVLPEQCDKVYLMRYRQADDTTRLVLEIIAKSVTLNSRRCVSRAAFDKPHVVDQHATDIVHELASVCGAEAADTATQTVVAYLIKHAGYQVHVRADGVIDRVEHLINNIHRAANAIGALSRRGAGNFIVVSPIVCCNLQTNKRRFVPQSAVTHVGSGMRLEGTLDETIQVYSLVSQTPKAPADNETILVGYIGGRRAALLDTRAMMVDTGFVYATHLPFIQPERTSNLDPVTMTPVIPFLGDGTLVGDDRSKHYYSAITVSSDFLYPYLAKEQ